MLEAFVGPRPAEHEGCHNDGNPANNHLNNLRWDTHTGNMADTKTHGTRPRGSRQGGSKLIELDVLEICRRLDGGAVAMRLAEEYGVHFATISDIKVGNNWSWLTGRAGRRRTITP